MAVSKWRSIADDLIKKIDGGRPRPGRAAPH